MGVNSEGQPVVHAHMVLGRSDGSTLGGHLIRAVVSPTLEVFVTTFSREIVKKHDDATDLRLFDLTTPAK